MKKLIYFYILIVCFSCKPEVLVPEPPYSERIVGNYNIAEQIYMNKPLDLNLDGNIDISLYEELKVDRVGFRYDNISLSPALDQPQGYFYLSFFVYSTVYASFYFVDYSGALYLLRIDDVEESIEIVHKYNSQNNSDISTPRYYYLDTIEADGEHIKLGLNQNMLVWDWDLEEFVLENIDVTYIYKGKNAYVKGTLPF